MVASGILAPVTEPTEWVSSMLVIVKPNKLRICLDPRDLNKAIRREHYQMPTVEDMHRLRKKCSPSLGHVISSTNTSMGETKSLSRLTMSH